MMRTQRVSRRILFCGYAPVHFVCFRPVQQQLERRSDLEFFFVAAPPPRQEEEIPLQGLQRLFRAYHIPPQRILSVDQIRKESFQMVISSFVSGVFPRSDRVRVHLFHGVSFRNMAVRRDILIYDYLFNVGPYQVRQFMDNQLVRKGDPRLVPIGFPKLDVLVNDDLDRRTILSRVGFSGRRPILLYAPTGYKGNSLELMGEEVIKRLRAAKRYDLLVKLHDHPRDRSVDWPGRLRQYEDAHTRIVSDYDVVPYLSIADLLITDASSVSSEYSLLDRPMVFIDVPQMLAAVTERGLALDLDTWGRKGGETARWPDEVVSAVEWSLSHPRSKSAIRRAMARDLFYNPGCATKKAADWILNWFSEHGEDGDRTT